MIVAKQITYITLIVSSFTALASSTWLYNRHHLWLQERNLDSPLLVLLIIFGIFVLLMPFHLRVHWQTLTPQSMVREFMVKAGQIMGLLGSIVAIIYLGGQLLMLPARLGYPDLAWLWAFLILIPLFLIAVDLANGTHARTWNNVAFGFLLYTFKLNILIIIQIVGAVGALLLFPAGFLVQFLSLVDIVMSQFGRGAGELPLLCSWAKVEAAMCTPVLFTFHIGHLLLVGIAALYGEALFNKTADLYGDGLEWLAAKIEG